MDSEATEGVGSRACRTLEAVVKDLDFKNNEKPSEDFEPGSSLKTHTFSVTWGKLFICLVTNFLRLLIRNRNHTSGSCYED